MSLVAGVDSSTQSCKVVVRDAATGAPVRIGSAPHPPGTEVEPEAWWEALHAAVEAAGGLADVDALSVAAQQHGMVCVDEDGGVVRPALLWNDTRSAPAAEALVTEAGAGNPAVGRRFWAQAVGSVPVASFTVTKLRWLAEHEPDAVRRTAAVCLPHDWLTWRLAAGRRRASPDSLVTDRADASGTGYWSPAEDCYREDLLERAMGARPALPQVLGPMRSAGHTREGVVLGPGTGDNAAAALALAAGPGDVLVSIGTSGVVSAVSTTPTAEPSGTVAGFADATGNFLPLVCTLNASRVLEAAAALLRVTLPELSELALTAAPGAEGVVLVPYLEGERTPNRPGASGALHGLRPATATAANLARAAVEGMLCGLAEGLDALAAQGVGVERVLLIGGGARSEAVCRIAPTVLGRPVLVPEPGEYVADGAARQAAWVLSGGPNPPAWSSLHATEYDALPVPAIRERYAEVRDLTER